MSLVASLKASAVGAIRNSRWPARAARHNPILQRPMARVAQRFDNGPGESSAIRAEVLDRTLTWAAATPYGLAVAPKDPTDLAAWPVLTKDVLKADESRFHRGRLPTIGASTGGTTGQPLRLRRSLLSLNAEQFFLDRLLAPDGVSFATSRIAVLRGHEIKDPGATEPPFGRHELGGHRLVLSSVHLNAATVDWYVDELRRFAPDFLWVYPATLSSLIRLVQDAGRELSIPLVVTSSETLFPAEAGLAVQHLGAKVVDYYGQAERVALAADRGSGYYFDPLYGTVELQPSPDDPAEDGLASALILGTGHWNSAMPLVRYATGDLLRYRPSGRADQLERIAAGLEPFEGIKGRKSDYLVSPDGGLLVAIGQLTRGLTDVVRMQVRQATAAEVQILLVTGQAGFTPADRETLDANVAGKFPPAMSVSIEVVDELPRTPAGKTPFVVRAPELG